MKAVRALEVAFSKELPKESVMEAAAPEVWASD